MPRVSISVRHLVEFVLRSGDLFRDFIGPNRMADGLLGQRRLQNQRPSDYLREIPVSFQTRRDGLDIQIAGRIDGMIKTDHGVLIEEIKTVARPSDLERSENPVHWAQLRVYAFIVAEQQPLDRIDIRLTYVCLDPWMVHEEQKTTERDELRAWFFDLLDRYLKWTRPFHEWSERRNAAIAALDFPYDPYRSGQKELIGAVYRAIESDARLFVQAPTGIGKTTSVLFPAIKALGAGMTEKVFYLTAKTSGRASAEKALDDMRKNGSVIRSVTLTARDRICFKPETAPSCLPAACPFALGYYDRINDALADTFSRHEGITREIVEDQARRHTICPFELALDLTLWSDVVICDYNHVFDPRSYLRRFFQEGRGRYLFLIDEAHNLLDRAREMFSAELSRTKVLDIRRAIRATHPGLYRLLSGIHTMLLDMRKRCDQEEEDRWVSDDPPEEALAPARRFVATIDAALMDRQGRFFPPELMDFYFDALAFLRIAELYDDHYITYAEKTRADTLLRLFCLDPSRLLRQSLDRGSSAVFFSATLTPLNFFREALGGDREDELLELQSCFPPENLGLLVADQVDTSYRYRENSYDDVAQYIGHLIREKQGNYMVFFPSYRYLSAVYAYFSMRYPMFEVWLQRPDMSDYERSRFLERFETMEEGTLIGFAVMGGVFGEGIDLVGDRLIGAVIVGVGLPQVGLERELIRGYFSERNRDGFACAYQYPGVNRVFQAAGRIIRSSGDRGVVLLIDRRFSQSRYRELFPSWWPTIQDVDNPETLSAAARAFWNR